MSKIVRRIGSSHSRVYDSAGTITAGDAVQFDENGEVVVAATGAEVLGIASADATSSDTVHVEIATPSSEYVFPIETGTMAAAEVGEEADINSADGLTLTESNNDVLITGWDGVSTDECYGVFKILVYGA